MPSWFSFISLGNFNTHSPNWQVECYRFWPYGCATLPHGWTVVNSCFLATMSFTLLAIENGLSPVAVSRRINLQQLTNHNVTRASLILCLSWIRLCSLTFSKYQKTASFIKTLKISSCELRYPVVKLMLGVAFFLVFHLWGYVFGV